MKLLAAWTRLGAVGVESEWGGGRWAHVNKDVAMKDYCPYPKAHARTPLASVYDFS